jgi:hypothetical protein
MSPEALSLLQIVVVVAGVAAVAYAALRLGLSRQQAGALGGLCLVVVLLSNLLGSAAGSRRVAGPPPPPLERYDAQRVAALRASAFPARGHLDQVLTVPPSGGAYDEPRRAISARAGDQLVLTGWAIAAAAGLPGSGMFALVDGRFAAAADYGADRPDVAQALGIAACAHSGFTIRLPGGRFGPGKHSLAIAVATPDGNAYETLGAPLVLDLR